MGLEAGGTVSLGELMALVCLWLAYEGGVVRNEVGESPGIKSQGDWKPGQGSCLLLVRKLCVRSMTGSSQ